MDEKQKKAMEPVLEMMKVMNWSIAIHNGGGIDDDGDVHGFIIGEQSYIDYILKHLVI